MVNPVFEQFDVGNVEESILHPVLVPLSEEFVQAFAIEEEILVNMDWENLVQPGANMLNRFPVATAFSLSCDHRTDY